MTEPQHTHGVPVIVGERDDGARDILLTATCSCGHETVLALPGIEARALAAALLEAVGDVEGSRGLN